MLKFLKTLPDICRLIWRTFSAVAFVFYREGRQALINRARARTQLEMLAVEQKKMEIDFQRANNVIDLVQKVEKITDPQLREKARAAISSHGRALLKDDDAVA